MDPSIWDGTSLWQAGGRCCPGRAGGNDVCIDAVVGAKGNRTPDLSHVVGVLCH